ncbi:MAG: hypothetical protein ACFFDW_13935, partial [Candidatus Thorarchaeota archaeon]
LIICLTSELNILWEISPSFSNILFTPCIIDLDRNNKLEILITSRETLFCYEMRTISSEKTPWYCHGGTIFQTGTIDSDWDYLDDITEQFWWGTNPQMNDTDNDLLTDGEEILLYHTDPLKDDTDEDGFIDGEEINEGTNPFDGSDNPKQRTSLLIVKSLYIGFFSITIGSVSIVLTIQQIKKQPKYKMRKALTTLRKKEEKISLEQLTNDTSLPTIKIKQISQKESFSKNNNIFCIENIIYFLENINLNKMIEKHLQTLNAIKNKSSHTESYMQSLLALKKEVQVTALLGEKLSSQVITTQCQNILAEIEQFMESMDFNSLMENS